MNRLAFSNLKYLLYSSNLPKELKTFENVVYYSKLTEKKADEPAGKSKVGKSKPVYITLLGTDGIPTTSILDSAIKLSKRRNLKLVKIKDYDPMKQTPVYQLFTGAEVLKEDIESKKKSGMKTEKILTVTDKIFSHDMESKCKQLLKWLEKRHTVRVTINGSTNNNKTDHVFKIIEEAISTNGRILQKRSKGSDLKFQIMPPKETNEKC